MDAFRIRFSALIDFPLSFVRITGSKVPLIGRLGISQPSALMRTLVLRLGGQASDFVGDCVLVPLAELVGCPPGCIC